MPVCGRALRLDYRKNRTRHERTHSLHLMAGDRTERNTAPADTTGHAPSPSVLRLVVVGPVASGRYWRQALEQGRLLLGRAPDNDLVLDESSVSARHARVDVEPDGTYLTDLGSTNGSWVNGHRVTGSVQLHAGDEVLLGRCELRIEPLEHAEADTAVEPPDLDEPAVPSPAVDDGPLIPARHPRRLLVSYDEADAAIGERILHRLSGIGHNVVVGRSAATDRWGGRLLDAMWSADAVVFVVSRAAADSDRVHREVHLAGAEHTTVVPVRLDDVVLPADLAFYEHKQPPVDFRRDVSAGLSELQRRLDGIGRKRIARPAQLVRRLLTTALVVAAVAALALLLVR